MKNQKKQSRRRRKGGNNALATSKDEPSQLSQVTERWMPIFPPKTTKILRYCDTISLNSTSGAVVTYVIRANDLFDPDFTGTGHQPMGFDQMMLFYNHFCVVKARLICIFKSTSGNVSTALIRQDAASTPLTVINRIFEFGGCVSAQLETEGTFGASKRLELSVDIAKLQGVNRNTMLADPSLRGDAATSPTEVTYFHIQLFDSGGATSGAYVEFFLEQVAVFMEPRDNIESLARMHPDAVDFSTTPTKFEPAPIATNLSVATPLRVWKDTSVEGKSFRPSSELLTPGRSMCKDCDYDGCILHTENKCHAASVLWHSESLRDEFTLIDPKAIAVLPLHAPEKVRLTESVNLDCSHK
jgi:hypothetical protein